MSFASPIDRAQRSYALHCQDMVIRRHDEGRGYKARRTSFYPTRAFLDVARTRLSSAHRPGSCIRMSRVDGASQRSTITKPHKISCRVPANLFTAAAPSTPASTNENTIKSCTQSLPPALFYRQDIADEPWRSWPSPISANNLLLARDKAIKLPGKRRVGNMRSSRSRKSLD